MAGPVPASATFAATTGVSTIRPPLRAIAGRVRESTTSVFADERGGDQREDDEGKPSCGRLRRRVRRHSTPSRRARRYPPPAHCAGARATRSPRSPAGHRARDSGRRRRGRGRWRAGRGAARDARSRDGRGSWRRGRRRRRGTWRAADRPWSRRRARATTISRATMPFASVMRATASAGAASSSASAMSRSRSRAVSRCSCSWRSAVAVAGGIGRRPRARAGTERAQGVEDHRDVDRLLGERAGDRREPAECRERHGDARQAEPGDDALHGDGAGAPRDDDGIGDAVEAVDQDHHVGRLRGGAGAARAHGDADVGGGERRRVVDAVADHQGRGEALLRRHGIDLVGRHAVRRARRRGRARRRWSRRRRRGRR